MILFFLGAFIAEIAGTITGFGSSSIFLPIANQFFDFRTALVLVAIYHIFGNLTRLSMFFRHWNARIFWLFGIPSIIFSVIGASLVSFVPVAFLKILLGTALTLFATYSLLRPNWQLRPSRHNAIIGGSLSGFSAGLIGTGWVLRGAFMNSFHLPKEQYIATIASVALLVDMTRIPIYFSQGFLPYEYFVLIPVLFVIALVGSYIGKKIACHFSDESFRKYILGAVVLLSIALVLQGYIEL